MTPSTLNERSVASRFDVELVPSVAQVVAWALGMTPVLVLIRATQGYSEARLEGTNSTLWFEFTHLLPPYLLFAVMCALLVPWARRFPFPAVRMTRAVVAQAFLVSAFPLVHLVVLDALHVLLAGAHFREHLAWLLTEEYTSELTLTVVAVGALHLTRHVRQERVLAEDALRARASAAEARLAVLSQQLHPHFLFNTLNTAAMLVREGESGAAVEVLSKLSDLVRATIRARGSQPDVTLAEELLFTREFLSLESMRFSDRLSVTWDIAAESEGVKIPFLLLQPLVENALRHGVGRRDGASRLLVRTRTVVPHCIIEIDESGDVTPERMSSDAPGHGIGLSLTRERLEARYGKTAVLNLDLLPEGRGSRATIQLLLA